MSSESLVLSSNKSHFDHKSVLRSFQVGDKVFVLLPVVGSALQAKFSGPYEVLSKLSETDYAIHTPERRRKSRICHVNMLKSYVSRDAEVVGSEVPVPVFEMSQCPLHVSKTQSC